MNDVRQTPARASSFEQVGAQAAQLRGELHRLAREEPGDVLLRRFALKFEPDQPLSLYRRFRVGLGLMLRHLGLRPWAPAPPWMAALKHADRDEDASVLLVWGLGAERTLLREACGGLQRGLAGHRHLAPVLITDVADFGFYSRLHWLVEYVPALAAPGGGYARRKLCYLAWRYQDAPVLPLTAGLLDQAQFGQLLDSVVGAGVSDAATHS